MTIRKHLININLLLLFLSPQMNALGFDDQNSSNCKNFKMEVVVSASNEVKVTVIGSKGKVRFFLIDSNERLLNIDNVFNGNFTGLTPGIYKIIASDLSGCSKETEFTLR